MKSVDFVISTDCPSAKIGGDQQPPAWGRGRGGDVQGGTSDPWRDWLDRAQGGRGDRRPFWNPRQGGSVTGREPQTLGSSELDPAGDQRHPWRRSV
eukprot:1183808-Prorocentrum_minimum.AAC.1